MDPNLNGNGDSNNSEDVNKSEENNDDNNSEVKNNSVPYCYINDTYKVRKKLKKNKDFLKTEYQALKNNVNHIRNSQITIMTAAISSTAVIWGFTYYFTQNNKDEISSILFLIPLFILIPSLIIFFDKSVSYSKLIGYIRVNELIKLGFIKIHYYRGYENYNKCFNCSYLNKCHLDLFKGIKKAEYDDQIDDSKFSDKIKKLFDYKSKIEYLKTQLKKYYELSIVSREYRFLTIGFISYVSLVIIAYIFALYTGYKSELFIENYSVFVLLLPLLFFYSRITHYFIFGTYNQLDENYWRFAIKKNDNLLLYLMYYALVIASYQIAVKYLVLPDKDIITVLSELAIILGIATLFISAIIILIVVGTIPILLFTRIRRSMESELKLKKNMENSIKYFSDYGLNPKKGYYSLKFVLMYIVITIYSYLLGLLITENLFIGIMLLLIFVLIILIKYCASIYCNIIFGKDNPNEYEKLWFLAIEKTDRFYSKFDEMEECNNDLKLI